MNMRMWRGREWNVGRERRRKITARLNWYSYLLTYCMSQKTFDVQHTTIAKVGKVLYLTYLTYLIPNSYLIFTLRWGKVKILTYFTYFTYT